ncbi:YeiH family protein [soil metagenome]
MKPADDLDSPRRLSWRARLPGLLLATALASIAWVAGSFLPAVGAPVFGIVLGVCVRAAWRPPSLFVVGFDFAGTYVLQASVIALGLGLSLDQLVRTGWESLPVMLGTLLIAFAAMSVFGRLLGVQGELRTLIGAGTAICGGSAIAAASAVIAPARANIAYAMSTIFLYNALAVLAFPVLGHILDLSQSSFGLWAGTAINDTSSVVGAAYTYGQTAGDYAVVVKLTRTLMIIPMVLVLVLFHLRDQRQQLASDSAGRASGLPWRKVIPWFVIWFVLAVAVGSLQIIPAAAQDAIGTLALLMITVALTAIGLSAQVSAMRRTGLRPLVLGGLLWVTVGASSLGLQQLFGQL